MAPNAFIELGLVYDLFEKGATHSRRARDGLVCGLLRSRDIERLNRPPLKGRSF